MKSESKKVWKFIIEREIEAPARFQAIQTHRAVMALLQQQVCVVCRANNLRDACLVEGHDNTLKNGIRGTFEALRVYLPEQGRFVEQLYGSGMVDEAEKEALIEPIERLERRLMRRGGLDWRPPRVDEVCSLRTAACLPPTCHMITSLSALRGLTSCKEQWRPVDRIRCTFLHLSDVCKTPHPCSVRQGVLYGCRS